MPSHDETTALEGTLKGQGVEAYCIVQALTVSRAGNGKYADYKIVAVSEFLPRGVYQLAVNGLTFDVHQTDLGWIAA
jgi:hypothetical protein